MKHSPAPWRWGDGFSNLEDKYADCQLYDNNSIPIIETRIDHHTPIWDTDEAISKPSAADRALIAAAPDLLTVCERALDGFFKSCPNSDIRVALEATIAKATGKDSTNV